MLKQDEQQKIDKIKELLKAHGSVSYSRLGRIYGVNPLSDEFWQVLGTIADDGVAEITAKGAPAIVKNKYFN